MSPALPLAIPSSSTLLLTSERQMGMTSSALQSRFSLQLGEETTLG